MFGLLRRRRHGVEADVREEHDAGAAQHAAPAKRAEASLVRRHERGQILPTDVGRAKHDEEDEDERLDQHEGGIRPGRLPDPDDEQPRDEEHHERSGQIEHPVNERAIGERHDRAARRRERGRNGDAQIPTQAHEVS